MLRDRIVSDCLKFDLIFDIFKNEPAINSVLDISMKKPSILFYQFYNVPISVFYSNMRYVSETDLFWETFSTYTFLQNIYQISSRETQQILNPELQYERH